MPDPAATSSSIDLALWLRSEFQRTSLPYTSLAEYLDLDRAAVSKMLNGDRLIGGGELSAIQGYFTVVPTSNGGTFQKALAKLQSARTRKNIVSRLRHWLESNEPAWTKGLSFARLVELQISPTATLRADQIVAICRVLTIDIEGLTRNGGVQQHAEPVWLRANTDAVEELSKAAEIWAADAGSGCAYQFSRGRPSRINSQLSARPGTISLSPGLRSDSEFERCDPYVINGEDETHLFRRGQTVYVQRLRPRDLKPGDIVVVFGEDGAASEVEIGHFAFEANDGITIDIPKYGRRRIPTSESRLIGRVLFCRL